ncbi:CRISPR-associated endoribonuclease Cas6 [Candidatus Syntrophocurvum alkaliphilum]|uniref:CRISPR-associated endoribonuclease n=1 Tax=Candidatus Syntrophocurvum alkaliphilum TaxID=2293317 RepID=A0A6I6DIZ6_9FIRM|nr:CRISPR-associated endoribonuclease Cas6 [Candidatus Syntrophocurvum alkaliphilum]QGT99804.1 CRISPR-associated endoribonuclease Cas6 [Candidatus Syntrophocurvum alkaliphilum]
MRISIEFNSKRDIILPLHYNYFLQAYLYNNLSDKDYSAFIHEKGYELEQKKFKLFTFSRLMGTFRINPEKGIISFKSPVKLIVSSAVEQFITDLAETLMRKDDSWLGNNLLEVSTINVHRTPQFSAEKKVKMISPMVAYTTLNNENNKKTEYYSPWNQQGVEIIRQNLINKYKAINGVEPEDKNFNIIPNGNQEKKFKKIITYKNTVIIGYDGLFKLTGNPELIQLSYSTGLGSKNSQGFGCWEEIN